MNLIRGLFIQLCNTVATGINWDQLGMLFHLARLLVIPGSSLKPQIHICGHIRDNYGQFYFQVPNVLSNIHIRCML